MGNGSLDELRLLIWGVPVVSAIVLHELAHGWVAYRFGDKSASQAGRLTLNPLRHLDWLGSLVVPALLYFFTGFLFGWAKPVPVDACRLMRPRRHMLLVLAAGPCANLLMALLWALVMKLGYVLLPDMPVAASVLIYTGAAGVFINAVIMMFNMLPIPPLDGGRMFSILLPEPYRGRLPQMEILGMLLLLLIIIAGLAGKILWPLTAVVMAAITFVANTPPGLLTDALAYLFTVEVLR